MEPINDMMTETNKDIYTYLVTKLMVDHLLVISYIMKELY